MICPKPSCFNIGIKYLDLKLLVDRIFPNVPEITMSYESAHLFPNSLSSLYWKIFVSF